MSEILLYNYFRSSTSYRVRIALNLKGVSYEYKPVHLLNNGGEQHSAEYKRLNPQEEVPTLVHNGKTLAQSFAIIEYLDEVFPQNPLFPQDAFAKGKIRQISENINAFAHPISNLKVLQYLEKEVRLSEEQKHQWLQHWLNKSFQVTETILKETAGTYTYGDNVTVADLFVVPYCFSAQRFHIDLTQYPTVARVNEACLKVPAFIKAHPFRQPDTPADLKIS